MNYLTNFYKNRCDQLQEQVNFLNNQLNEMKIASPSEKYSNADITKGHRRVDQAMKRDKLLGIAQTLAKIRPTEFGDIYKRLQGDMLKGIFPEMKTGTTIGMEQELSKKAEAEGRGPSRSDYSSSGQRGAFDDAPEYGYLTPPEARKLLRAAQAHGYK